MEPKEKKRKKKKETEKRKSEKISTKLPFLSLSLCFFLPGCGIRRQLGNYAKLIESPQMKQEDK